MYEVSTFRLYVLRATYLLIVVGLAFMIWPLLLNQPDDLEHMRGVVWSLLAGVSVLAAIGLRYPLQMLPVLLFELVWKSIWLLAIGLPHWSAGTLEGGNLGTWSDCLISVPLMLIAIPWGYVWRHYVRKPGDRWKREPAASGQSASEVGAERALA